MNSSLSFLLLIITHYNVLQTESSLRVYGGRDALRDEFPYVVRIEEMTRTATEDETTPKTTFWRRCTGAALTSSWILSAAHCHSEGDYTNPHQKLVARYNSYFPKYKGKIRPILEVKIHPTYTNHSTELVMKDDICLFRSEGISVSRFGVLSPVEYKSLIGHEASTLGFGGTNSSEYKKPLQVLKGMLYDCSEETSIEYVYMLCLMPRCGVQTTICGGDSGGPVVHSSGIVGVNSMSKGDCHENSKYLDVVRGTPASLLALVSPNLDWISNIISNKSQH